MKLGSFSMNKGRMLRNEGYLGNGVHIKQERQRDKSLIPGLGRSPGGGHGNPLQYSCLENSMDRDVW